MKNMLVSTGAVITVACVSIFTLPNVLSAGCTVSHQECEYKCTEYYPNGTDCKKSKKVCHTVCDDFTVDQGGIDDANVPYQGAGKKNKNDEKK